MKLVPLISILATLPAIAQTINPATRTITTSNFSVTWNTGVDAEAITVLDWKGSPNITNAVGLNTCNNGDVLYFGNSWAPPDPQSGGFVLVGGGTVTPTGKLPWVGQVLKSGILEVTVNSNSANCPPSSAGVNVQTTYRFFNPKSSLVNWFQVERVFDFTNTSFPHDLRPYLPRVNLPSAFTEVIYPTTASTLQTANASSCPAGCTGPRPAAGAAPLTPAWNPFSGWFAIHDPTTLDGIVIKRESSSDPQGDLITPQLWIDYDNPPPTTTNASSFLLLSPPTGFTGGLVIEVETLCFYNSAIWTPSLQPPVGCRVAPLGVFPSTLTFPAQLVGLTSPPQTANLQNFGATPLRLVAFSASGDFAQTNNCPAEIAAGASCTVNVFFRPAFPGIQSGSVSIFDGLGSSPLSLTLAGSGVAAQ